MKRLLIGGVLFIGLTFPLMPQSKNYTAERIVVEGVAVVRLADAGRETEVLVSPSAGNNAYSMTVKGNPVFWAPYETPAELKARPRMGGNPFLAPWANRIDGEVYHANGKKYLLNPELGNYRTDGNGLPIHGLLVYADGWKVTSLRADAQAATLTCRLEFWRNPEWMAQFPFAHNIEMTYRLSNGELEVETTLENLSHEPMPVSVGYHTYYQINDAPRGEWKVRLAARERLVLSDLLVPTGQQQPVSDQGPLSLAKTKLDDLFGDLIRNEDGRAEFSVEGAEEKISVVFGPKYTIAVVYAPEGRDFICFEPMSGPTNAFNLAQSGAYDELQTVEPGGTWRESFWIRPSGF